MTDQVTSPEGLQARARAAADSLWARGALCTHNPPMRFHLNCRECVIDAFVALAEGERQLEREECAKVAERGHVGCNLSCYNAKIAAAIRSRSTSAPAAPKEPDVCTDPNCPGESVCGKPKRAPDAISNSAPPCPQCGQPFIRVPILGIGHVYAAPVPSSPEPFSLGQTWVSKVTGPCQACEHAECCKELNLDHEEMGMSDKNARAEERLRAWAKEWPGTFDGFTVGAWDALVGVLVALAEGEALKAFQERAEILQAAQDLMSDSSWVILHNHGWATLKKWAEGQDIYPPSTPQREIVAKAMDALESDASLEQRREAWDALRDEFFPTPESRSRSTSAPAAPEKPHRFGVPWDEQQEFRPSGEDANVPCTVCGKVWREHTCEPPQQETTPRLPAGIRCESCGAAWVFEQARVEPERGEP